MTPPILNMVQTWEVRQENVHSEAAPLTIFITGTDFDIAAVANGEGTYVGDAPTEECWRQATLIAAAPMMLATFEWMRDQTAFAKNESSSIGRIHAAAVAAIQMAKSLPAEAVSG